MGATQRKSGVENDTLRCPVVVIPGGSHSATTYNHTPRWVLEAAADLWGLHCNQGLLLVVRRQQRGGRGALLGEERNSSVLNRIQRTYVYKVDCLIYLIHVTLAP